MSAAYPEPQKVIAGHQALKAALRDTETYSSDLQGDADVRDYRQIPLEVDPPRHHLFRSALAPFFVKSTIEGHIPAFRANSLNLISAYFKSEPEEVIPNLTLALVMSNLGAIYNRPQDVAEWISWGPDVWTAESETRSGSVLHRYLDRIYDEAISNKSQDIWREIAHLEIQGTQITREEFFGIAGVLLAGGRDTVIKLLTGILWHFGRVPSDFENLKNGEFSISSVIQELLRFLTPLPAMSRTTIPETGKDNLPPDRYVSMSFISANFDDSIFPNPFKIDFTRARIPHMSFGFGPHTCIGNHVAEIEAKVFLEALLESGIRWNIKAEDIQFHLPPYAKVPNQFRSLKIVKID